MKIDWMNPKKYLWPLNVITFNLSRLSLSRNNNLWVFGAWEGMKYDDNARTFFEYVNKYYKSTIRCVWLTNEQKTVEYVRSYGYEAYTSNSSMGKKIQMKAGVAIYTNGVMDFGLHPKVAGAFVVSLWHGVGFKKTYNEKYSGFKLLVKKIMDKFFSWTYRDLTLATSSYVVQQFKGIFSLSSKAQFAITGQPRNDIFKEGLTKKDVLSNLEIDCEKKIILYMPTYRSNGLACDAMEKIVLDLYNNETLKKVLQQDNCLFIAKLHPMCSRINVENRCDFIVMDNLAVESNQKLLAVSDVLVTDYSSCVVDFALLERPVVFYTPDHDKFIAKSEPIYDEFFDICKLNQCETPNELADKISHPSLDAVDAINQLYQDSSIRGTCFCENVFREITSRVR